MLTDHEGLKSYIGLRFLLIHTLWMEAAKSLAILHIGTGAHSHVTSFLDDAISNIISCAGPFML